LDVRTFNIFNLLLQVLLLFVEGDPVVFLDIFAKSLSISSCLDGVVLLLFLSLGLALHSQEDHLLLPHLLDGLSG